MPAFDISTVATEINRPLLPRLLNDTRIYSPLVLNRTWPALARLAIFSFFTIFGITMNGFFIATFIIEKELRKIGNVFLACVGVADLLLNGGAMFTSSVVLISGNEWDTPLVCHGMQTLVTTSAYCYSIFFSLVAFVSWCRVNQTRKIFQKYLKAIVAVLCFVVFVIGFTLAVIGVYFKMDFDYCERKHHGNYYFRKCTAAIHGFAFIVTVPTFIASYLKLERRNRGNGRYRQSFQYRRDLKMMGVNLPMYIFYVLLWVPFLIVINLYPTAPDWVFYQAAALSIIRALLTSIFYGFLNNIFRRSYTNLYYYCLCRTSLKTTRNRHRRTENNNLARNVLEIRTHIMHQAVNQNGPPQEL